jgi:hypothetical protein
VIVAGDGDQDGFAKTVTGFPWLAVPFDQLAARKGAIEEKVPCTGYPTPGVVDAKTGNVLNADAFDEMGGGMQDPAKLLEGWLTKL